VCWDVLSALRQFPWSRSYSDGGSMGYPLWALMDDPLDGSEVGGCAAGSTASNLRLLLTCWAWAAWLGLTWLNGDCSLSACIHRAGCSDGRGLHCRLLAAA
jgi:hypothetical protein